MIEPKEDAKREPPEFRLSALAEHYRDRALAAEAEVERLREAYSRACDRIAAQSELLSRRAEK